MENNTNNYKAMTIGDFLDSPVFDVNCEVAINRSFDDGKVETVYDSRKNFGSQKDWFNKVISYVTVNNDEIIIEFNGKDNRDWIVEGMGEDCRMTHVPTLGEARELLATLVANLANDQNYDSVNEMKDFADYYYYEDCEFMWAIHETFQGYMIYREPLTKKEKMKVEVDRAMMGIVEYQFELMDSDVISYPLIELGKMINEMEEE